ncbi:replication-relaxation family protein [Spongiactinospora rosea]|uniref:replication-relaxation family protein n=1 Tax=Spongiactinospora rosea TaxID=2248750 RepID=UPI001314002D|nr:replication-relaxation family protein [Spongiactinospora rosea]
MNEHYTPTVLASLATRLTARDRRVLRLVWTHRVLTSHQIAQIAFDDDSTGRHRLVKLHRLSVVERFRPKPPTGSAPWHYVLGEPGAAVLAAEDGVELPDFGYRRDRVLSIAYSQRLAHTVGVNDVYARLYATARRTESAQLQMWWPETLCAEVWGKQVRPDAYGRWRDNDLTLDFFLEYDTGTETLDRVAAKLTGYAALAAGSAITTPVLFLTSSKSREANLRRRLALRVQPAVPIATAAPGLHGLTDPAGPIWAPGDSGGARLCLAELAHHWPNLGVARNDGDAQGNP